MFYITKQIPKVEILNSKYSKGQRHSESNIKTKYFRLHCFELDFYFVCYTLQYILHYICRNKKKHFPCWHSYVHIFRIEIQLYQHDWRLKKREIVMI